jgi:hypothetical protein
MAGQVSFTSLPEPHAAHVDPVAATLSTFNVTRSLGRGHVETSCRLEASEHTKHKGALVRELERGVGPSDEIHGRSRIVDRARPQ